MRNKVNLYDLKAIEERIMSIASQKGLSKNKLLANAKLHKSIFDNMKKGQIPSVDKIHSIADYLDCSVDYLLGRIDILGSYKTSIDINPSLQNLLLSKRIKERCKHNKITIKTMLMDCNMNRNTIYDLENKSSFPSSDKLSRIADYLDCSVDYLLGRTDNPISHKIPVNGNITVSPSNDTELQAAYSFKSGPVIEDEDEDDTITSK